MKKRKKNGCALQRTQFLWAGQWAVSGEEEEEEEEEEKLFPVLSVWKTAAGE